MTLIEKQAVNVQHAAQFKQKNLSETGAMPTSTRISREAPVLCMLRLANGDGLTRRCAICSKRDEPKGHGHACGRSTKRRVMNAVLGRECCLCVHMQLSRYIVLLRAYC